MTTKHLKIAIFTAPTGHRIIANHLHNSFSDKYRSSIYEVSSALLKLYRPIYLFFPQLFKIPFDLVEHKRITQLYFMTAAIKYRSKTNVILDTQQPHLIISTWYFDNYNLAQYAQAHQIPFLNIITDPRTISSVIPHAQAINFVFDDLAKQRLLDIGIPESQIVVSGWFTNPAYYQSYDQKSVRRKLKISTKKPVFLFTSGSLGTNSMLKIIPSLITTQTPLTIVFSCGSNRQLYHTINSLRKIYQATGRTPLTLIPLRHTNQLYRYMQAADLVVGKAGPNTLFESVATHTPFFAVTHISGQEDGNLDVIREYNLGYVEEHPLKAGRLLKQLAQDPTVLDSFLPSLRQLATHNQQAQTILLNTIQKLLEKH